MPTVQIFGVKNSQATRAAERFFKERRIPIQLVDLKQKPMAPAEIGRFVQRFGLAALIDTEGKAYVDAGLRYLKVTDSELLQRIERDPALLRLPWFARTKNSALGAMRNAGNQCSFRNRGRRDLKSRGPRNKAPNKNYGALHYPISLGRGPFWSPGRNRGRTNNGSACRPLFCALTANRASRTVRPGDQIHHGYDLVLDWTVTPRREGRTSRGKKSA